MPRVAGRVEVESAYADIVDQRAEGRPWVVVNMVASVDGAISLAGRTKELSSEADRDIFHHLRSLADVILVGAQTVRAEGYGPPRISEGRQAERVARGQSAVPRIAIVSGSLDLDWSSRLFTESPTRPIVLTAGSVDTSGAQRVADVVVSPGPRVDLAAALAGFGEQGVGVVLCEGGPTLNGVLAAAELIDELCLTVVPVLAGGAAGAGLLARVHLADVLRLTLVHAFEDNGDLFLRYRRETSRRLTPTSSGEPSSTTAEAVSGTGLERGVIDAFDGVMAGVDLPMVIVTAADGQETSGCLVGFHAQSSIDPPRYTVWISKRNHTFHVALRSDVLAVHFPASDQRPLADLFGTESGDALDKLAQCRWHSGPEGAVVLDDVARWVVGRVIETVDNGDHVGFVLHPIAAAAGPWSGQLGFQSVKDLDAGHDA